MGCKFDSSPIEVVRKITSILGPDYNRLFYQAVKRLPSKHYLVWHKYADGQAGVGITIRYGQLKEHLQRHVDQILKDDSLISGKVGYGSPFRTLPFNKRPMFRNEKEVRFAFMRHPYLDSHAVDVGDIFKNFGLRFSPDVPEHHFEAAMSLWIRCGGQDRFQRTDA